MFTGIVRDEDLALHGEVPYLTQYRGGNAHAQAGDGEDGDPSLLGGGGDVNMQDMSTVGGDIRKQWEHAATLKYFLDRKEYLLESLKVLNNLAEQELLMRSESEGDADAIASESQFTDNFLQQHQWVIDNVMRSDHIIAQLLQQLNSDASLQGQSVMKPSSPSKQSAVIEAAWKEQYGLLDQVSVPTPARGRTDMLLGGGLAGGGAGEGGDSPHVKLVGGGAVTTVAADMMPGSSSSSSSSSTANSSSSTANSSGAETGDADSALELYKTCMCCLTLLRKFQLEEFCRPKELCEFLVSKVDGYNDVVPMRNVVQKIEAICFGLS
jgi:hypothetical protein